MNKNINPIDFALAVILASVESLLWIINELLGLHASETALEEPTRPAPPASDPIILSMTVKQLQALTGVTNSRVRKAQLQEIALAM
jgi:hypothetical protein